MSFSEAISVCFSKYATFQGRASRSEFWYFYLFYVLVTFAAALVSEDLSNLATVAMLLPIFAVSARRLHDVDRSGWFVLVPLYNIILLASEGTEGDNRFGPKPVK